MFSVQPSRQCDRSANQLLQPLSQACAFTFVLQLRCCEAAAALKRACWKTRMLDDLLEAVVNMNIFV